MADTTKELETLEDGTVCRVKGRVKVVFDMADGVAKKSGRTWYRQDFILADSEGETKVGWFSPPSLSTMGHLEGREVEVQGEVNHYRNKDKELFTSIKASGKGAVKALDGESLDAPPASAAPSPASRGGSRSTAPSGGLQAADVLAWMKATAPEVQGIVKKLVPGQVSSDNEAGARVAQAVTECGQRLLTTLLIQVLDGKLAMGEPEPPKAQEEEQDYTEEGEPIPFAWFLPFLVGGVLPWVA